MNTNYENQLRLLLINEINGNLKSIKENWQDWDWCESEESEENPDKLEN